MKTISKLRLLGCPDDMLNEIADLPTTDLVNDAIVGCVLTEIVQSDVQALQLCEVMNDLIDDESSKAYIETLRNGN